MLHFLPAFFLLIITIINGLFMLLSAKIADRDIKMSLLIILTWIAFAIAMVSAVSKYY